MKKFVRISLLAAVCSVSLQVSAQLTQYHLDPDAEFKNAKDLYQKEQFSLAYPVFKKLYSNGVAQSNTPDIVKLESKYYYLICGLQINDDAIVESAQEFIELENNPARIQMMSYHLGEYYFRKKDFPNAQKYYGTAGIANLSNREIADMKFHQAYGYFVMQQFDKAKPLFNSIRQIPKDPNYLDANYYFGFISFTEKNYPQALESFEIAEKLPEYQGVIPFYKAEIYYFKGDREKALETGEAAINKSGQFYDLQLRQLVGHIYFEKKEFAKALPYLEKFVNAKEKVRREDLYELSFCYYATKNLPKAIEGFKQLGGAQDSLAQNSMYLLADAYLKTNDKPNARTAFQFCASNNSNAVQKEVSAFNYGKLSYELGYMDQALKAFQSFIPTYPRSTYLQEARELLVNTLANTSNYKDALRLYESLAQKSDNVIKLYPRLLYGSAVELINDQNIERADSLLTKLLVAPYNTAQLPLANFWKGEIAYRNGQTDQSITYFLNYLKTPVTNGEVNITNARYSLAYGYFKNEAYTPAKEYFEQIAKTVSVASPTIEQDAYLRAADCYFMNKDFRQAQKMYETVSALRLPSADYALYQRGVIAGALNKNTEKVSLLQSLEKQFPASALIPDANLEIANTYLADENFQAAIAPLQKVISNKNATSMAPQAYLKLGVAYFNLNKNDESLNSFKKLVTAHPNTQESNDAIEYIRNIFVENQRPGEFAEFMKQNGKPISDTEEDSLTFRSSMLRYEAKDLAGARSGFAAYLSKFPTGRYSIEANYLTAEMLIANKDNKGALPYYKAVADRSQNKYAERSTLQVARIYYFDLKDYANAQKYFDQLKTIASQQENRLEAMRGLLRCQFKAQQWKEAAVNAEELLLEKGIATDDRMMASLVVAKNRQMNNEGDAAILAYKQVIAAGKSEYAAESQYHIAEILLQQNKLTDAEKAAFEVIKKMGSYELWVTKSYVLLGDIYVQQKDLFNAEATYKSIVENATIPELKAEAQQKLDKVLEEKNKVNKVEQPQ
ncbi:MAG: tetratricopeptide repeat protein [Bacteroidota bacterium]